MSISLDQQMVFDRIKEKRAKMSKLKKHLKRLDDICEHVVSKWDNIKIDLYPYTPHDYTHSIRVEELLYEFFSPEELNEKLSSEEIFLLLASIWLHDIGMIPQLFSGEKVPKEREKMIECNKKVREKHEERSERYISENKDILRLPEDEANALMEICRHHRFRKYKEFKRLPRERKILGDLVHIPWLIACLRLADAFHIPHRTGIKEKEFRIYIALGLDVISKINWLKSKYAWRVFADKKMFKISIVLKKPPRDKYPKNWDEEMKPLKRMLEIELQNELDAVREILIEGGLPVYLITECKCEEFRNMSLEDVKELGKLLTDIELFDPTMSPNATSVQNAVLKEIDLILDPKEKSGSLFLLKRYKKDVLGVLLKDRPCHVFFWTIKKFLDKNIPNYLNRLTDRECDEIFNKILNKIVGWQKKKIKVMEDLPERAYNYLKDGTPVLLYGYSSSVVKCIKYLVKRHKKMKRTFKVYVCQAATKNRYRYNNRLVYCDGIKYIDELKKETEIENIIYIPDSCASNLFSRNKVKKVLFGANGIDRSGYVAHTLGHLAIADMAKNHNKSVFVIADSSKIGNFHPAPKLEREDQWLTTDVLFEPKIEGCENYNPREDIVPPDRIKLIITEKGAARPRNIWRYAEEDY